MQKFPENAALFVIDVQKGFDDPKWGKRNNPQAEHNIERLLNAWRDSKRPVVVIQHLSTEPNSPLRPDSPGCEIKDVVKPKESEWVIQKNVNSAFIGTNLEQRLRDHKIDTLVITGLTTQHCVSTTTRMAGNLGFKAYLVADATAAFATTGHDGKHFSADEIHEASLATLHGEFATVLDTEAVLQRL